MNVKEVQRRLWLKPRNIWRAGCLEICMSGSGLGPGCDSLAYTTCARCIPKLLEDKQMRKIPCLTMFGSKPWPFGRPLYLGGKLARGVTWLAKQLPRQCGTQAMLHSRGRSAR